MHNRGGRFAAQLLQALGENTVSEAKEEGLVRLASGLEITYSTVTVSYDDTRGVTFCALIDAAAGHEPLLNRQVGVVIFCFDFTGVSAVTYCRGGSAKKYSLPPPKDFLFCPLPTTLSKASLDCLAKGIHLPQNALIWAVSKYHGKPLGDDWLRNNPPPSSWTGETPSSERILTLSIHRY